MDSSDRLMRRFSADLWLALGAFALCVGAFVLYARAEAQAARAGETRLQSLVLADELRQSSDDLTRMARTYVATGDPRYRRQFEEILGIRNGTRPRPERYHDIYWDLVLDEERPTPMGKPAALLDRVRGAGFTSGEIGNLVEAIAHSDALTAIEVRAMGLVEPAEGLAPPQLAQAHAAAARENRDRAIAMLHDDNYHRAKAAVMVPIAEFNRLASARTQRIVDEAAVRSRITLSLSVLSGAALVALMWRLRATFRRLFGASMSDVHAFLSRAASGDLSVPVPLTGAPEDTMLGKLARLQENRASIEARRRDSELALSESERRFRGLVAAANEGICVVQDAVVRFVNPKVLALLGCVESDLIDRPFIELVQAEDRPAMMQRYRDRVGGAPDDGTFVRRVRAGTGSRTVEIRPTDFEWEGRRATLYLVNEMPEPKAAGAAAAPPALPVAS